MVIPVLLAVVRFKCTTVGTAFCEMENWLMPRMLLVALLLLSLTSCAIHVQPSPIPPAPTPSALPCESPVQLPADFLQHCDSCVVVGESLPPCSSAIGVRKNSEGAIKHKGSVAKGADNYPGKKSTARAIFSSDGAGTNVIVLRSRLQKRDGQGLHTLLAGESAIVNYCVWRQRTTAQSRRANGR